MGYVGYKLGGGGAAASFNLITGITLAFVSYILYSGRGLVVGWLVTGRFVTVRFVTSRFVTGRFMTARFVTGRFVTGRFEKFWLPVASWLRGPCQNFLFF